MLSIFPLSFLKISPKKFRNNKFIYPAPEFLVSILLLLLGFYKLLCKKKFRLVGTPPHFFPRPIQTIVLKMVKIGFSFFFFFYIQPFKSLYLGGEYHAPDYIYIHSPVCW
jgi:hypothetical protein